MAERTDFIRKGPLDLQCYPMILTIRTVEDKKSGHSDFGIPSNLGASSIFTRVSADIASAACPSAW